MELRKRALSPLNKARWIRLVKKAYQKLILVKAGKDVNDLWRRSVFKSTKIIRATRLDSMVSVLDFIVCVCVCVCVSVCVCVCCVCV